MHTAQVVNIVGHGAEHGRDHFIRLIRAGHKHKLRRYRGDILFLERIASARNSQIDGSHVSIDSFSLVGVDGQHDKFMLHAQIIEPAEWKL